jgi:hypothetical protein
MTEKINIAELQQITNEFFEHILNVLEIDSIELTESLYWSIHDEEKYKVENQPQNMGLGDLYDDMEFLKHILKDKDQAVPAMMMHLAPILDYLSTKADWYGTKHSDS